MKRDYPATVAYLFGRLPMYQRTGELTGKLDLSKTEALMAALGHPEQQLQCVHVGGTNGKGTVSHTVASLLTDQGLRVGLYTSPHYVDYRERIRINGEMISEAYVVDFVERYEDLIEGVDASFFEFTVALAFAYFAECQVDVAVIEVGLGGRLDSTNVILAPLVSTITNIDLDHTEILGNTLPAIAAEKAGIIKSGRPVVIGRLQSETWPIFQSFAERLSAPLQLAEALVQIEEGTDAYEISIATQKAVLAKTRLSVAGPFAVENLRTALATYELLRPQLGLAPARLDALSRLGELSGYTGRFLTLSQNPLLLTDAGHNLAAWRQLVPQAAALRPKGKCLVVCGFVKGKYPADFMSLWPTGTRFFVGDLDLPRNRPSAETLADVAGLGLSVSAYPNIPQATRMALNEAAHGDLIFVGGSSYVVGALLEAWPLTQA